MVMKPTAVWKLSWSVLFPGGSSGSSNDNRNYRYSNRYYNSAVTHSDYEMTSPQVHTALHYWLLHTQWYDVFKSYAVLGYDIHME